MTFNPSSEARPAPHARRGLAHPRREGARRAAGRAVALLALGAAATGVAAWWPFDGPRAGIDRRAAITVAIALTALAVALALAATLAVRRRWLVLASVVLAWWLAVERFAAPHLVFKLRLVQYFAAQDPDHWPKATTGDWNEDSLRGTPPAREFTPETFNVLFLGDSFTFGQGVAPKQTFAGLAAERLGAAFPELELRLANFGWSSSSPLLSLRRLEAIGARYHPDVVLLCVDMTDFGDDIRWQNLIDRRRVYWLYDKLPITLRAAQAIAPDAYERFVAWTVGAPARRFFHSEAPLAETRPHMQPLVDNVARIHAWCAERGADFVLVALPRSYQHSARECPRNWEAAEYEVLGPYALEPFKLFDELRARGQYPVWSLLEAFQTTTAFPVCLENDPHWTPAGHRVAADALAPQLVDLVRARLAR